MDTSILHLILSIISCFFLVFWVIMMIVTSVRVSKLESNSRRGGALQLKTNEVMHELLKHLEADITVLEDRLKALDDRSLGKKDIEILPGGKLSVASGSKRLIE